MALIIEGPDLSGKTSLIKDLNWHVHQCNKQAIGLKSIKNCLELTNGYKVWDRGWPSEYIYSKLFRNADEVSYELLRYRFELDMLKKGALIYFVPTPSVNELTRRYEIRGDNKLSLAEIFKLTAAYQKFQKSHIKRNMPDIPNLEETLKEHRRMQDSSLNLKKINANSTGTLLKNKILFVTSIEMKNWFEYMSVYFIKRLVEAELYAPDIHISFGVKNISKLIDFVEPYVIVALGPGASKNLQNTPDSNIYHRTIPDPDDCNRKYSLEEKRYTHILRSIKHDSEVD